MGEVFKKLIRSNSSITARKWHSSHFKSLFNSKVVRIMSLPFQGARIRDLQSAPHRFASTQKPLGRFVLLVDAILATAGEIAIQRAQRSEGRDAMQFLENFNAEQYLTLAMLADAGDECNRVVRVFDSSFIDLAVVPRELRLFLERVHVLFIQRAASKCGYTQYALNALKDVRMIPVKNGQLRTFGGADSVTPELLDRLYSRMASWIRLLDSTMRAEFPSWEILSAFNVFDLGTKPSDAVISESLSCLAKAFGVNPGRLGGQFVDFKTFAQVVYNETSSTDKFRCLKAWQQSVDRVSARGLAGRSAHPFLELQALMIRYAAFCSASTSGVERSLAALENQVGHERRLLPVAVMVQELKLKHETDVNDYQMLARKAQQIWNRSFPRVRISRLKATGKRLRRWASGKEKATKRSEASWIRSRREAVEKLSQRLGSSSSTASAPAEARTAAAATWTPEHQKAVDL